MLLICDILYLELADLVAAGLSDNYVKRACTRCRNGESGAWYSISHPDDKRRVLVAYSSIPDSTKGKYNIKSEAELRAELQKAKSATSESQVKRLLTPAPASEREAILGFRITKETTDAATGEVLTSKSEGLPSEKIELYLKQAIWLRLLGQTITDKSTLVSLGVANAKDAWSLIVKVAQEDGANLPSNERKLREKVKDYNQHGILELVSGKFGNTNKNKVDQTLLDLMISLYADRRKPSIEVVHKSVVAFCHQTGREIVSLSTVKHHLNRPEVIPVWTLARDGATVFKNQFGYSQLTMRPTFRDALWVIDGTKVNLAYRNGSQRKARLMMVAVVDAFSDCILGWSIKESSETVDEVAEAVRMAIRRASNCMPVQFLYDNDGSNKLFFKRWTRLAFPAQPYNGQSKPIERLFGQLQTQILRQYDGFTGMNITTKSLNSHIDFDSMPVSKLPDLKETMKLAEITLLQWNNTPGKDGKTPNERYKSSLNPEPTLLSEFDERELFWVTKERPVTYGKQGLNIQFGVTRKWYEVYYKHQDGVSVPDVNFSLEYSGKEFWVKHDPEQGSEPKKVALYTKDAQDKMRFVALAEPKVAVARAVADYSENTRAQIETGLDARKAQVMITRQKLDASRATIIAIDEAHLDPYAHTKDARNKAEEDWLELQMNKTGWSTPEVVEPDAELVPVQSKASKTKEEQYKQELLKRALGQ